MLIGGCDMRDATAQNRSMRELKHHERKLLKKVDFVQWKHERNIREIKVLRRYLIQDRGDYVKCVPTNGEEGRAGNDVVATNLGRCVIAVV